MQPPSPAIPPELIEKIIHGHERDGISFAELWQTTAVPPDQLSRMVHGLRDAHLIEARADGRLYPRARRRKPKPVAPTFWQRVRAVWAP